MVKSELTIILKFLRNAKLGGIAGALTKKIRHNKACSTGSLSEVTAYHAFRDRS